MASCALAADMPQWTIAKRIAFRFVFVYVLAVFLSPWNQVTGKFWNLFGLLETMAGWWFEVVNFAAQQVFGATITALPYGSGDTTFNYVELFCWAGIAVAAACVWSIADWRRPSYPRLFEALRVAVRLYLAFQMIDYGIAKVLPMQFGTLQPSHLVKSVGEMSPMGLLWTFMAASPAYAFFGGAAEIVGGMLLVFRRTTLLGALVCAGVMSQVVMLNFCYDVPVKLLSSQLLAMAIFLTLPDAKRLWDLFVLGRPVTPAALRPRFRRRWLNWSVASATAGLFVYLAIGGLVASYSECENCGLIGPPPPLAGIWNVVEFQRDGQIVRPLATDSTRWKQVLVQNSLEGPMLAMKPMTGPADGALIELDEAAHRIKLIPSQDSGNAAITLAYEEPAQGVLVLWGKLDGKALRVKLNRASEEETLLTNRGFHWVNEVPFNR